MNTNTTRSYKDLIVWQKGIALAKLIYRLTQKFPSEKKFGLVAQMRRAAVSIPSNIAEGQARHTTGEFIQFISHAEGSVGGARYATNSEHRTGIRDRRTRLNRSLDLIAELRRMLNVAASETLETRQ